ncbi:MAG: LysE family translocator [Bacteroidales bacterium]|jgi:threonine/homoserine/homoserine lactone efflux protein|nr:LysE family translocator [Bacteroidales bacterium]
MEVIFFLKGIIVGLLASIPLGPVGVLCIQRTLNKGRLSGFLSGMGAATVDAIFALIAAMGLTFIINFIEQQRFFIQIIGGIVLIIMGLIVFYKNPVKQMRRQKRGKSTPYQDFFSVFLLTLSNPVAVFLFVAALASIDIVSVESPILSTLFVVSGVFLGALLWWVMLISFVDLFRKKFRLKQLWWINKIAGVLITGFGIFAILAIFYMVFK